MKMILQREPSVNLCTHGALSVDGVPECVTLEDEIREVADMPVETWKIPGQTAIPVGTFGVIVDFSSRFNRLMPHIVGVDGFTGIRLHSGNTAADTEGCILVGRQRDGDMVTESRIAFEALFAKIKAAAAKLEPVQITILNPAIIQ